MQIGNGSPLSIRREWKKAQDHGHHGESSQRTSAVFASWWWWWTTTTRFLESPHHCCNGALTFWGSVERTHPLCVCVHLCRARSCRARTHGERSFPAAVCSRWTRDSSKLRGGVVVGGNTSICLEHRRRREREREREQGRPASWRRVDPSPFTAAALNIAPNYNDIRVVRETGSVAWHQTAGRQHSVYHSSQCGPTFWCLHLRAPSPPASRHLPSRHPARQSATMSWWTDLENSRAATSRRWVVVRTRNAHKLTVMLSTLGQTPQPFGLCMALFRPLSLSLVVYLCLCVVAFNEYLYSSLAEKQK